MNARQVTGPDLVTGTRHMTVRGVEFGGHARPSFPTRRLCAATTRPDDAARRPDSAHRRRFLASPAVRTEFGSGGRRGVRRRRCRSISPRFTAEDTSFPRTSRIIRASWGAPMPLSTALWKSGVSSRDSRVVGNRWKFAAPVRTPPSAIFDVTRDRHIHGTSLANHDFALPCRFVTRSQQPKDAWASRIEAARSYVLTLAILES